MAYISSRLVLIVATVLSVNGLRYGDEDLDDSGMCLCNVEDVQAVSDQMKKKQTTVEKRSTGQKLADAVVSVLHGFTTDPEYQLAAGSNVRVPDRLDFHGHWAAFSRERLSGLLFSKIPVAAVMHVASKGLVSLGTTAGIGAIVGSAFILEAIMAPMNLALSIVVNHQKFIDREMDRLQDLPKATQACAESYANIIRWMVDTLLNVTQNDMSIVKGFLEHPGVEYCVWQPTGVTYDRSTWRGPLKNDGKHLFHGDEGKKAAGLNFWGWIIKQMHLAYDSPGPHGTELDGPSWNRAITYETPPKYKKSTLWWQGRLDKYAFGHHKVCTDFRPRETTYMMKRTVAMFACQLKKWASLLDKDVETTIDVLAEDGSSALQSRGITEEKFSQKLDEVALEIGLSPAEYKGKTMKQLIRSSLNMDTTQSVMHKVVKIVEAVI
eukprot:TRINITY_DN9155_c0_g1_i1.p1 TRINITY_DN9155_c0_g1~~TRINITY_DN9155_c0_g1_i1.p1  ORF type:complete len:436 (+),score=73.19 TRINITY_DN9155_c0_g1_i1:140-1447(+)